MVTRVKGVDVHSPLSPARADFSIAMGCTVRQKSAIATLCVLCGSMPENILHTDKKKENEIFLIYKEIQLGSVAKSYKRKGFLIM
jgi:hypothetical protein